MSLDEQLNLLRTFFDRIPFNRLLGMEIDGLQDGFASMSVPFQESLIGDARRPAIHGGVISALLDTCGGAAMFTRVGIEDTLSTVDLRVDYLQPGRAETIFAEARVLRMGNRVGVADIVAYQAGGRDAPIAIGRGVYNIIRRDR